MADENVVLSFTILRRKAIKCRHCAESGAMESFFGRLKTKCYFVKRFDTFAELERTLTSMCVTTMTNVFK